MASTEALLRRVAKLKASQGIDQERLTKLYNEAKDSGELPTEDSPEAELVRRFMLELWAIEVVQEGVPAKEWTEEHQRAAFGGGQL